MFQHPVQTMRSFCARSVGVVDGSDEEGDGDDASPCLTSLSLMLSTLPPLPSSWQKEGRIRAVEPDFKKSNKKPDAKVG